jgi:glutathione S-transferase
MPLTVHHLQVSQSERIPWLCEELEVPYTLKLHQRDPIFSPQSIKDLSPIGQAPVIQDGDITLFESGACVEYIIQVHGNGKLTLAPSHKNFVDYIYWLHFSNGTFQPLVMLSLQLSRFPAAGDYAAGLKVRLAKMLELLDARLTKNTWLAGEDFTAADIMIVFTLTTMRAFNPYDLTGYDGILAYLQRVVQREGYQKARARADPDLELRIEAKAGETYLEKLKAQGKL